MKTVSPFFRLKVQKIEQVCLFELTWGQAQSLTVHLPYPANLTRLYQEWRQAYLSFYQSSQMRGRVAGSGIAPLNIDWHAALVKAEAKLLSEFHQWLRSAELYEIRARIALANHPIAQQNSEAPDSITLCLTCAPIELARLPWEAWEIGSEFAPQSTGVRVIRSPLNIDGSMSRLERRRRGRTRILAILGDDTGLSFQTDRDAVRSLLRIADVTFVGWQPGQNSEQVIQQISNAIDDERGWDILFFAGHSNELEIMGGELGVAPGVSMSIHQIMPQLIAAKQRGLQVAIFNSCSGLNIADSLVSIGFNQVVIMREPIHNCVAQEFLVQFLQGLAKHQDVQTSLLNAKQFLRLGKSQTYPSAYLVPSLFCYPEAPVFRISAFRWNQRLRQSLPSRTEAIAFAALAMISLTSPLQEGLLAGRMFLQSGYRDITGQVPPLDTPPVALVQIDTQSINRAALSQISPLDRSYLAKLIQRLKELKAEIIGVDVVLDVPQKNPPNGDEAMAKAVRESVAQQNTWFLFAAFINDVSEVSVDARTGIADPNWSLQGFTEAEATHTLILPFHDIPCDRLCPFSYLLSLLKIAHPDLPPTVLPQLNRSRNLRSELLTTLRRQSSQNQPLANLLQTQLSPVSMWTPWLTPMIDFSIPPDRAYQKIPAWQLLNSTHTDFSQLPQQIVIIAGGNDERLGFSPGALDRSPMPPAALYWQPDQTWLSGGESLSFMVHHFLTQRLVTPIPDLWMIGIAALFGKALSSQLRRQHRTTQQRFQILAGLTSATAVYGLVSTQIYISAALLIPFVLPSTMFWVHLLPILRKKNHG
jgi:hypothetical protein